MDFQPRASAITGKEAWTIRDWEKNDPKGLASIKETSPSLFEDMYNSFYKKA
jgi:hypothetical protein